MARVSTPVVLQFRVDDKGTVKIKSIDRSLKKNAREFDKNGKEVTKWSKTADRARKATALLATGLGVGLVAGFGAGTVALRKFSREFNDMAALLDEKAKMGRALGFTTDQLLQLEFAAGLSSLANTDLMNSMRRMAKVASDANHGLTSYVRAWDTLGVEIKDAEGNMKPMLELLYDSADGFAAMEAGAIKTGLAQEIFGRQGAKMLILLDQGSEGLRRQMEEGESLGLVIDNDLAAATERYNDNLLRMRTVMRGVKMEIFSGLVNEAAAATDSFAESLKQNREQIGGLADDIIPDAQTIVGALAGVADMAVEVSEGILVLTKTLQAFSNTAASLAYDLTPKGNSTADQRADSIRSEIRQLERMQEVLDKMGNSAEADKLTKQINALNRALESTLNPQNDPGDGANPYTERMKELQQEILAVSDASDRAKNAIDNFARIARQPTSSRPSGSGGADIIDIGGEIAARDGGGTSLFTQLEGIKQRAVFDVLANQARGFANEIKASYLETQRLKQETQALQKATEEWRANRVTQGIDGAAVGPLAGGISAMSSTISGQRDYEKQLEELKSFHARKKELMISEGASIAEIEQANADHKIEIDQANNEQRLGLALGMTQTLGATLEGFRKQTSDDSVEGAILQKGLAISEATIATYLAATQALSWGLAGGPAIAAAITAMGLANVGLIAATPIQRYHTGGVVEPGPGGGPGETLAMLRVGETVRTQQQEAALGNRGGTQRAVVVYREDVEDVIESWAHKRGLIA
jgi:hypothetical protein